MSRPRPNRLLTLFTVSIIVLLIDTGVLLGARTGWVAYGPRTDHRLTQVRFLNHWLDGGGAVSMQGSFPEGSFFS